MPRSFRDRMNSLPPDRRARIEAETARLVACLDDDRDGRDSCRTPSEIVNEFIASAPVDVQGLAIALGIEVETTRLWQDDTSGAIKRVFPDRFRITINDRHPPNRQRYTLAHEIAHFVLHRDMIGDGITDDAMYRSSLGGEVERQANCYAADLLMPAGLVRQAFRRGIVSYVAMAEEFGVSAEAARIRMKELWKTL